MTEEHPFRILLVEDNEDHACLIADILEKGPGPVEVERAPDGGRALQRLGRTAEARPGDLPDLVLLDLDMPEPDGFETLDAIKSQPVIRRIPVVVLTTSRAEGDVALALERYANSYICKTTDFAALERALDQTRAYWRDVCVPARAGATVRQPGRC